jgi:hypothetical protein
LRVGVLIFEWLPMSQRTRCLPQNCELKQVEITNAVHTAFFSIVTPHCSLLDGYQPMPIIHFPWTSIFTVSSHLDSTLQCVSLLAGHKISLCHYDQTCSGNHPVSSQIS